MNGAALALLMMPVGVALFLAALLHRADRRDAKSDGRVVGCGLLWLTPTSAEARVGAALLLAGLALAVWSAWRFRRAGCPRVGDWSRP